VVRRGVLVQLTAGRAAPFSYALRVVRVGVSS
jgi:hypothetical protein